MSELLDACAALRDRWSEHGLPLIGHLRPPTSTEELQRALAELGITPASDLLEWWSWHDGVDEGIDPGFGPSPLFSVKQAVDELHRCRGVAGDAATEDRPPSYWWHPQWFPISRNGSGGEVTVDCANAGPHGSDILMVYFSDDDFWVPKAHGLVELVTWWIKAWDVGVYTYEPATGTWGYHYQLLGEHSLPTLGGIV